MSLDRNMGARGEEAVRVCYLRRGANQSHMIILRTSIEPLASSRPLSREIDETSRDLCLSNQKRNRPRPIRKLGSGLLLSEGGGGGGGGGGALDYSDASLPLGLTYVIITMPWYPSFVSLSPYVRTFVRSCSGV